jgi:signal transduction histidine kinase
MSVRKSKALASPKARKQTDQSLSAERAKTDESLKDKVEKTEHDADADVIQTRVEADKSKSVDRLKADDSQRTDARLRLERQKADLALATERRHMDSVLYRERKQRKAVQVKLFQTERKETDQNLTDERSQTDSAAIEAAEDLEKEKSSHGVTKAALITRDEFLAIVSHDLKNPLSAILMAASLLSEKLGNTVPEESLQFLQMIERSANEAVRLINDLMDIEQIAAGKLGIKAATHNLFDLIQRSTKNFQLLALAKQQVILVGNIDDTFAVKCDQERILQVLSNLIGNAIKFTPHGGSISVNVEAGKKEKDMQISITDTGPGIPDDMQKTVFKRFWQLGTHDRRGLGLGLYISKMIVEAHGGRIWVDSTPGAGCCFHFTLPKV